MTGKNVERLRSAGFGRMKIERNWKPWAGEPWALDNGAFRMWNAARKASGLKELEFIMAGQPGLEYDWTKFEKRLLEAVELTRAGAPPMFVVVPDLVAKGLESLLFSLSWLQDWGMRCLEHDPMSFIYGGRYGALPMYLAVQDGMTPEMLEAVEDAESGEKLPELISGIFLGGSVKFKETTAADWREWTSRHGLKLHYARAGTVRKLTLAHAVGADSVDSAAFLWSNEKWTAFEVTAAGLSDDSQYTLEVA